MEIGEWMGMGCRDYQRGYRLRETFLIGDRSAANFSAALKPFLHSCGLVQGHPGNTEHCTRKVRAGHAMEDDREAHGKSLGEVHCMGVHSRVLSKPGSTEFHRGPSGR